MKDNREIMRRQNGGESGHVEEDNKMQIEKQKRRKTEQGDESGRKR